MANPMSKNGCFLLLAKLYEVICCSYPMEALSVTCQWPRGFGTIISERACALSRVESAELVCPWGVSVRIQSETCDSRKAKLNVIAQKSFYFREMFWLWCCISCGWICICICWHVGPVQWPFALQVLTHLLGWPRGIRRTLRFLHIKITMWKSGLQNLKYSERSLQFYRRSHRTLGNLHYNL